MQAYGIFVLAEAGCTLRGGDANMRSVWLCSRNDALSNLTVMVAALDVFGTGSAWPDLGVAAVMAALALSASWQVVRQAQDELVEAPMPSRRHQAFKPE